MRRAHENITEFKNGNINIRLSVEDVMKISEADDKYNTALEIILNTLWWLDLYVIGDPVILGNDCGGYLLYCYNNELEYILIDRDVMKISEGKTAKIYGHPATKDTLELALSE